MKQPNHVTGERAWSLAARPFGRQTLTMPTADRPFQPTGLLTTSGLKTAATSFVPPGRHAANAETALINRRLRIGVCIPSVFYYAASDGERHALVFAT